MNNHAIELAKENKDSIVGQIDYINEVLAKGNLDEWEVNEYEAVLIALHEDLGNASIRLVNCLDMACN